MKAKRHYLQAQQDPEELNTRPSGKLCGAERGRWHPRVNPSAHINSHFAAGITGNHVGPVFKGHLPPPPHPTPPLPPQEPANFF